MTALFCRLEAIYGSQACERRFGAGQAAEASMEEWAQALAGLSGAQIKRALETLRAESPWPPTIAEFLAAAKGNGTWEHASDAYRIADPRRLLCANPARPETVANELAAMRAALTGGAR